MPNTYTTLSGLFAAIANAIRAKKGTTGTIVADNFPSEIESIASQPSLQSKTVSPSTDAQTITPDSGYDGLSQVVVNAISPTKGAQTYTPTTTDQTISSGLWLTGAQTIKGDANLVASNIRSGVSIFGVSGNYSGETVGKRSHYEAQYTLSNNNKTINIQLNSSDTINRVLYISGDFGSTGQNGSIYQFFLPIEFGSNSSHSGTCLYIVKYEDGGSGYINTSSYIGYKDMSYNSSTNILSFSIGDFYSEIYSFATDGGYFYVHYIYV